MFSQKFTVHPVGQGLFYSCVIERQQKVVFRMVFDCGSKTAGAGQDEVEVYRDTDFTSQQKLDLLVISHFDSDHVNHIDKLLNGGIKIKRLVMPLISYEERLFLVLKLLIDNRGYKDDINYTTRLILDPLMTLAENLDDDSEAYLIESDPNSPIGPNNNEDIPYTESEGEDEERLIFEFPTANKEEIDQNLSPNLTAPEKVKVFRVYDSDNGSVSESKKILSLINFLFYKKSIKDKEKEFYKKVKELFFKQRDIDPSLESEKIHELVSEEIKRINSSKEIVKLFNNAAGQVGIPQNSVNDLNTTALCMLHRNLPAIINYATQGKSESDDHNIYYEHRAHHIHKFFTNKTSRVTRNLFWTNRLTTFYKKPGRLFISNFFKFPNVLLTSDCFLLNKTDVDIFLHRYRSHFSNIWLFQIPHHGSIKNSDTVLHSQLTHNISLFINYGIGNNHKHPSSEVIDSIVSNGLSNNLYPINQFQGLSFCLNLETHPI